MTIQLSALLSTKPAGLLASPPEPMANGANKDATLSPAPQESADVDAEAPQEAGPCIPTSVQLTRVNCTQSIHGADIPKGWVCKASCS